jgi:hypothetical protein
MCVCVCVCFSKQYICVLSFYLLFPTLVSVNWLFSPLYFYNVRSDNWLTDIL